MSEDAHTLIQRGHAERRADRPEDARRSFTDAVAAAREAGNDNDLVLALKGLGQVERDIGELERALALYEEAAELCLANEDLGGLAHTLRHLGDIHQDAVAWSKADEYYEQALGLYRRDQEVTPLELANALRPLAQLRVRLGDHAAAEPLWRVALALYLAAGIAEGAAECDRHLS
jgi:tetratricopeptide (TPR) repeat protein